MSLGDTSFARYDDEFQRLQAQIRRSLEEEPPNQYTRNLLQQCDDLLQQMGIEARSVGDATMKRDLLDKVRTYKSRYQSLQAQSERQGLIGSTTTGSDRNQQERMRLQQNEDALHSQNETLDRARRTMRETESVALEITEELGANREKLVGAHGRVREMSGLTGRATRILQAMNQRATQQKLIMFGVAVGLVLAFLVMLYRIWR
jgi:predicted RND superfamily exporter protein